MRVEDFVYWINSFAKEIKCKEDEEKKGDSLRKFYVYALCERAADGRRIPFYIGKGTDDRVWAHERNAVMILKNMTRELKNFLISIKRLVR